MSEAQTMVLLPIHEQHLQTILDGSKQFEYRRRLPQSIDLPCWYVFYVTKPVQAIAGAAFVDDQIETDLENLIQMTLDDVPQDREALEEYFAGAAQPGAVEIAEAHPIEPAIPWELAAEALGQSEPPQSFQYLTREDDGSLMEAIDHRLQLPTPA